MRGSIPAKARFRSLAAQLERQAQQEQASAARGPELQGPQVREQEPQVQALLAQQVPEKQAKERRARQGQQEGVQRAQAQQERAQPALQRLELLLPVSSGQNRAQSPAAPRRASRRSSIGQCTGPRNDRKSSIDHTSPSPLAFLAPLNHIRAKARAWPDLLGKNLPIASCTPDER